MDTRRARAKGCAGVDLLAYRATEADPIELVKAAREASDGILLVAGAVKSVAQIRIPKGEAYARIESPRGELGYYLVSDESPAPYRFHIRPPSFINLSALREMTVGGTIADAIVVLGSIDIVVGEIDR